jgi:hypothetical protein
LDISVDFGAFRKHSIKFVLKLFENLGLQFG